MGTGQLKHRHTLNTPPRVSASGQILNPQKALRGAPCQFAVERLSRRTCVVTG
jgi:hypothetical protein